MDAKFRFLTLGRLLRRDLCKSITTMFLDIDSSVKVTCSLIFFPSEKQTIP